MGNQLLNPQHVFIPIGVGVSYLRNIKTFLHSLLPDVNVGFVSRVEIADQKDADGIVLELNSADWPVARLFVYSANTDDLPCTDQAYFRPGFLQTRGPRQILVICDALGARTEQRQREDENCTLGVGLITQI